MELFKSFYCNAWKYTLSKRKETESMATKVEFTKYRSSDGKLWDSEEAAIKRDALCDEIAVAMMPLGNQPDLGHGKWIQHTREDLFQARRNLWEIVKDHYGRSYPKWLEANADDVHPFSVVGRVLSDCGGPLDDAWGRLRRCNFENCREYDQAYYAMNPKE